MVSKVLFSSNSEDWSTPPDFYEKISSVFPVDLDPCASHENAKCPRYFTKETNGLDQDWKAKCTFVNPPYTRKIIDLWVKKSYEEVYFRNNSKNVLLLIPARTDTIYFHKHCWKAEHILFVKGRLKFGGAEAGAPFPSALVIFGKISPDVRRKLELLNLGYLTNL